MTTFKVSEHPEVMCPMTDREVALCAALQERDAEIAQWKHEAMEGGNAQYLREKLAAQRKVLEQALEALENWRALDGSEFDRRLLTKDIANTITAIQEQLK